MDGVDGAAARLRRGVSVEIVGRPSSGRTEFLDRTTRALEEHGVHILRIHGIGGWRDRAFGSVAASLPELSRQPSIGEALGLLDRELVAQSVLVVDDADDLDDVSAGVIAALRTHTPVPLLFARRVGPRPSAPLRRLFASLPPVVRYTLRPLRYSDLQRLVESELEGPVDVATMARIATKSGGLPGIARDLARVGKQTRRLTRLGTHWVASDRLWATELGSSVDSLLVDALPDDVDALTTLALAGPVSVADLSKLVPLDRAQRINDLGLIELIDGPDGGTVGIFPPLIEEYLSKESSTSKRYAVRELLLAEGLPVPPGLVADRRGSLPTDNAILSRTLAAHWAATIDHLVAQWRSHPVAETAVALMAALLSAHRTQVDPAVIVTHTEPAKDDAVGAELAGWYAVHLAASGRDLQGATSVLVQAAEQYPGFAMYLRAVRNHLALVADRVPGSLEVAAPDAHPLVRDATTGVRIEALMARGRPGAALAELDAHRPTLPLYVAHAQASRGLAFNLRGEITRGISWALARLETAQREYASGGIQANGYAAALGLAIRGDLAQLDELVSYVMTITSTSTLHSPYHEGIVGLDAARSRWLGLPRTVPAAARVASPMQDGFGPFPFVDLRVDPDEECTASALWTMAGAAADSGYTSAAIFAMVEAAELGPDPERFVAVRASLTDVDSPFLLALVDLADGMVHRDVEKLSHAQDALESFGAWLYVARAGVTSALVLREQGELMRAAQLADRVWALVASSATGAEGLFAPLARSMELSPREVEVAELAVEGLASGEIASTLVLSVRTVENHIFNTYRKIGVESRGGLRRAFTTWLRPGLRARTDVAGGPRAER